MGNAAYEARRNEESARRMVEERKASERERREAAAEALFDVMLPHLKDFFDGNACLVIEAGPNDTTLVRFRLG